MNLALYLSSLSATYTRYLVDYFPTQLADLHIRTSDQNPFDWIDIVGIELALIFMAKAGSIEETNVDFKTSYPFEELGFEGTKATIFLKLLNEFRRTQQTYCEASFWGNANEPNAGRGYSFRYTNNGKLFVECNIHDSFFPPLDLPDRTSSSVIGPEIFNALGFNISDVGYDVVLPALDYSLSNCPELQSFRLTANAYEFEDFGFYLHCYHNKDLISSDPTNRDINYLKIAYINNHVQVYFDPVTAHLHDIEIVYLEPSEWCSTDNNLVLDLTGFKKLKTFKYIARVDQSEKNDDDFILFQYTNGEERYYYLDKKKKGENSQVDYSETLDIPSLTVYCDASVAFSFRQIKINTS
ncbi:hypothetical protein HPULCUR_006117 [Helicostylum pulchrum]|uniref:Uncharacterized protein n=1 Tax=Helicostylum pulchrum TaxID=562976 RepID=A0ABP9Y162_9FUNG